MKTFVSPLPLLTLFLSMALMAVVASCSDDDQPAPEGPSIAGFTPNAALPGATVTITGTNFIATAAQNIVSFNGTAATVISATETSLVVTVPEGAATGPISVTVDGTKVTSSASFTPLTTSITAFSPESGVAGTAVTISGTNFSSTVAENIVEFNGVQAEVTDASATELTVIVPAAATDGKITVSIHGKVTTSADEFTILKPSVTGIFPDIAAEGITVTISGANFSEAIESNLVTFNGVIATVTAATATELTVVVPTGATTGTLAVTVGPYVAEGLFEVCSGGPELVISDVVASHTGVPTSYSASFTITNVGSEDADLSKIILQNYASVDEAQNSKVAAGGFMLTEAPVLAPGESYQTGNYGASLIGANTTTHPYLVITLSDSPDGSLPECNDENNVVVEPFK